MNPEIIVRLKITSPRRTPQEISDAIGLDCDRSWRIGDKRGNTLIIENTNGWVLNSNSGKNASLEMHIDELLGRLSIHADRIRSLTDHETVELSCVVYAFSPPALNFDQSVIQRLARLGASLDIDLYCFDDGNDQANPSRSGGL
jgi:hypothetical protein